MRILITGAGGQLSSQLVDAIRAGKTSLGSIPDLYRSAEICAKSEKELDICNRDEVLELCRDKQFDVIFNCAAFTNVDACEEKTDVAYNVNATACGYLAQAAKETGAKLVHISTDYVFDGKATTPYTEDMDCCPETIYGKSKYNGEIEISTHMDKYFIIRTSWLYGYYGSNFVKTILKKADETDNLRVVCDQFGTPTFVEDLVHHMLVLADTDNYGLYHCTGEGETCTWFDFADYAVKLAGKSCTVNKCTTDEFPRPAKRPAYSRLKNSRLDELNLNVMRDWRTALEEFISNYNSANA